MPDNNAKPEFDLDDDTATDASFAAKVDALESMSPRPAVVAPAPPPPAPAKKPFTRQSLIWAMALGSALDRPRCRR